MPDNQINVGEIMIDLGRRTATVSGKATELTSREWAILDCLIRRKGALVSKSELEDSFSEFGAEIESNSVEANEVEFSSRSRICCEGPQPKELNPIAVKVENLNLRQSSGDECAQLMCAFGSKVTFTPTSMIISHDCPPLGSELLKNMARRHAGFHFTNTG